MKKTKAKSILNNKVILANGLLVEMKIWEVEKDLKYPDGYKYSLYAIYQGKVVVGYDNHSPKGHHRHIGQKETKYEFSGLRQLVNDFKSDIKQELAKLGAL